MTFARLTLIGFVSVAAVLAPAPAFAQHDIHAGPPSGDEAQVASGMPTPLAEPLPHGIPDFSERPGCTIIGAGATMTLRSQAIACLQVRAGGRVTLGQLADAMVGTLQVMEGGTFDSAPGTTARLTILDQPLDTTFDPEQYGTGLIVFGEFKLFGQVKTPFLRLATEPMAGDITLSLAGNPVGWQAGDRLAIPDTRHLRETEVAQNYRTQTETITIAGVAGRVVTLSAPLQFAHRGARNPDGLLEFLPHVANLTRSIVIRSANPAGTRGHVLATGRADVDVRYVRFEGMGRTKGDPLDCTLRSAGAVQAQTPINGGGLHTCNPGTGAVTRLGTNHIGRYALHFHHLDGPAGLPAETPQFRAEGNAFEDSRKWPIAVHNSHYGLVTGNVMRGWEGSGLMTEDGSETGNVIEDNFALDGVGKGGGRLGGGREGVGFYFRGVNNIARRNVAANILGANGDLEAAYGYKFFQYYLGKVSIPTAKGAATRTVVDAHTLPVREFSDNEVYNADQGVTYWWIGSFSSEPRTTQFSVLRNTRVWHVHNIGLYHYDAKMVTIDGWIQRGDPSVTNPACCGRGIYGGDYMADTWTIRNVDIQGMGAGVEPSSVTRGPTTIEHGILRNNTDIALGTLFTSAYRADVIPPRQVVLRNLRFRGQTAIRLRYRTDPVRNLTVLDRVDVDAFNGVTGDTFRVYYTEQAPSFVVPQTISNSDGTPSVLGAPSAGTTNAQLWASSQKAIAGAVADCAATRAGIVGIVCRSTAPIPPSPAPSGPYPDPAPTPGGDAGPPSSADGDLPSCQGLNCLPLEGPLFRGQMALTSASTAGDFDGDAKADPTLFHSATGLWHTLSSRSRYSRAVAMSFGALGDVPVPDDYDGDGLADAALYRPATGAWLVAESRRGFTSVRSHAFGAATDNVPVPADYDGDRRTDLAVFRPSTGLWSIRASRAGLINVVQYRWGVEGDLAAAADFDGDGRADPTVYRPSASTWHVLTSTTGFVLGLEYRFGEAGDVPVPADYDGDGRADLATYQPASGLWRVLTSTSGYSDVIVRTIGSGGDYTVTADDDGDGRADIRIYRRASGEWLQWSSSSGFLDGRVIRQALMGAIATGAAPSQLQRP